MVKQVLSVSSFGGMNQGIPHGLISDGESIFSGNMIVNNGVLEKRSGFTKILNSIKYTELSNNSVDFDGYIFYNPTVTYTSATGYILRIYCARVLSDFSVIYSFKEKKLTANTTTLNWITFGGKLYMFCDYDILEIKTLAEQGNSPDFLINNSTLYEPCVMVNCSKEGAGNTLEDMNLLTEFFRVKYSYKITADVKLFLPDITINVENSRIRPSIVDLYWNGAKLTLNTQYKIGEENGRRYFTIVAPYLVSQNNLEIRLKFYESAKETAIKTFFNKRKNDVLSCKVSVDYGGSNDTRILLANNGEDKALVYRSGVLDCTYFPENSYEVIGDNEEAINGFVKQYDCCLVMKENSVWRMEFNMTDEGAVSYPVKPLNSNFGCSFLNCVESIENNAIMLNKKGLYRVYQSNERGESNVGCISDKIATLKYNGYNFKNSGLFSDFKYLSLKEALSSGKKISLKDDLEKLYIACGTNIFVYDYKNTMWYLWQVGTKDINGLSIINDCICFSTSDGIYRFYKKDELDLSNETSFIDYYSDKIDGSTRTAICSSWISKQFDFEANEKDKTIDRMYIELSSLPRNSIDVYGITEENELIDLNEQINDIFAYNRFSYGRFTYNMTPFARTLTIKKKFKKIGVFQFMITNNVVGCASNVQSFDIRFKFNNYKK